MNKYHMQICSCGRIHMIDIGKINKTYEENKNLLLICAGCGEATLIGADKQSDPLDSNKSCYFSYAIPFSKNQDQTICDYMFDSIRLDGMKALSEILYSHGYKVAMMTGRYATCYIAGRFFDYSYDNYTTKRPISETDRSLVNMKRFISDTPDDILKEISRYWIEGFDWTGTKWEQKN